MLYLTLDPIVFCLIVCYGLYGAKVDNDWLGALLGITSVLLACYFLNRRRFRVLKRAGLLWLNP